MKVPRCRSSASLSVPPPPLPPSVWGCGEGSGLGSARRAVRAALCLRAARKLGLGGRSNVVSALVFVLQRYGDDDHEHHDDEGRGGGYKERAYCLSYTATWP
ncbi:MAG: hypothetical protein ACLTSG_07335 [Lachnospiraceae bacterium]